MVEFNHWSHMTGVCGYPSHYPKLRDSILVLMKFGKKDKTIGDFSVSTVLDVFPPWMSWRINRHDHAFKAVTIACFKRTGIFLVLSDRKKHCETLQGILRFKHGLSSDLLTGDLNDEARRQVLERLRQGKVRVLIATGQLIGEGFDCPDLSTLFLATPVRFSGRIMQYLGRILRPSEHKQKAKVYDYVDVKVAPLLSAARARQRVYGSDAGELFK